MRDPLTAWSFPIPVLRPFGITIRIHWMFPVVALGLILQTALARTDTGQPRYPEGAWIDMALILGLLFFSVLLHEFGHCFAARMLNGEATDVLLWPLGGLASVDVPHTPRAHFLTAAAGPAVNLLLATAAGVGLYFLEPSIQPPWDIRYAPSRAGTGPLDFFVRSWSGVELSVPVYGSAALLARFFWVNYVSFLFNIVLVGFPMDAGRMFQAALWKYVGYRQATLMSVYAGFVTAILIGLCWIAFDKPLLLGLALFICACCYQQWFILENGGEEGLFGYDFSQGYTSLERDEPVRTRTARQPNWFQRWRQKRRAERLQREQEKREAEDRRLDELLEKVHREGKDSLTDEERRFMQRVSERLRNRD
jgi:Zn-dependent protease